MKTILQLYILWFSSLLTKIASHGYIISTTHKFQLKNLYVNIIILSLRAMNNNIQLNRIEKRCNIYTNILLLDVSLQNVYISLNGNGITQKVRQRMRRIEHAYRATSPCARPEQSKRVD